MKIEFSHVEFCHKPSLIGAGARPSPRDAVDASQGWKAWRDSDDTAFYYVQHSAGPVHEIPASNVRYAIAASKEKTEEKPKPAPVVVETKPAAEPKASKLPPRRGAAVVAESEPVA